MNRIDKINERLQTDFYIFTEDNIDGEQNEYREAHEDIEYLLSLVKKYKAALEGISSGGYWDGNKYVDIAQEALRE